MIRSELAVRSPGSSIIGEELDDIHGDNHIGWIVDPIDGTINFLYNLPVVSVSVAATRHGIVSGAGGEGTPIAVSGSRDLATSLVGTGFSYDSRSRAHEAAVVSRVLPGARDIRCFGSAALHLCWVGCGRLDACYQRGPTIYDYAAGALIASEAGAAVELPNENDQDLLVATTPQLMTSIQGLVAGRPPR